MMVPRAELHEKGYRVKSTFVLLWGHGSAWVPGKTVREQPYWDEHASFMDRLFDQDMVVLGGPFADTSGSLLIVEGESEADVVATFADDPFVVHAIFTRPQPKEWLIFLDSRTKA
jgi:uncharacterized protein YciI